MSTANDEALNHLKRSEHRFRLFLAIVALAVAVFTAWQVVTLSNFIRGFISNAVATSEQRERMRERREHRFQVCFFSAPLDARNDPAFLDRCEAESRNTEALD